ncbi:MAG: hypothetical protein ACP5G1_01155 [Nanopusillaceae archaeon]
MMNYQEKENEILNSISNLINKVNSSIIHIRSINMYEKTLTNQNILYQYQLQEINYIFILLQDLINILELLKSYLEIYHEEISQNPAIPTQFKAQISKSLSENIKNIKNSVDRLFLEFEMLSSKFE